MSIYSNIETAAAPVSDAVLISELCHEVGIEEHLYRYATNEDQQPMDTVSRMSSDDTPEPIYAEVYEFRSNCQSLNRVSLATSSDSVTLHGLDSQDEYQYVAWYVTDNPRGRHNTQLLDAVEACDITTAKRILRQEHNGNATCRFSGVSACHAAAYVKDGALLYLLINHGAICQRQDRAGRTPLHFAAWAGHVWNIAMLLDFPKHLLAKYFNPMTPEVEEAVKALRHKFQFKVDVRCVSTTKLIVAEHWKDNVGHKCKTYMTYLPELCEGWTPLHVASYAGHHHATRLLLAAGANPNTKDILGRTPLDIAGGKLNEIDVDSYVETIKTLIEYDGELNWEKTPHKVDSALHIAVELCSVEAIRLLVDVGAPITYCNMQGNTPLHECVLKFYEEPLQILANHRKLFHTHASPDVRNTFGYTVLHFAIFASWLSGVRIVLEAGADITLEDKYGYTAIHLAAIKGNIDILNEILNAAKHENAICLDDGRVETPLTCAIRSKNLDCVQAIVDAGASLNITTYFDPRYADPTFKPYHMDDHKPSLTIEEVSKINMILHATAETSDVDTLEFLLDHDKSLQELLYYRCPYLMDMTPVEFAAHHNRFDNFRLLLERTIKRAQVTEHKFDPSKLLNIVASLDLSDMFYEIIKFMPDAVYYTAKETSYYPLHDAINNSKRNMILQLIRNGADLSQCDESGNTAISLLIEKIPKPTDFLSSIFDSYIQTNNHPIQDRLCEITVDYRVLIPIENPLDDEITDLGQMKVVTALLKTGNSQGQRKLLDHPLIKSFLYLKWKTLSNFFFILVFLNGFFVTSLSIYIVSIFYHRDKKEDVPLYWNSAIWQFFILITGYLIVIQELFFSLSWLPKVFSMEFWVKFGTYSLALTTPVFLGPESPETQWHRHLATLTLMLAWVNIMLLLSRTPTFGYYIQMFWKVSTKVIKILLTFSSVIVMFAFGFMIQFNTHEPFDSPLAALVKTLVMMTTEFDYDDTFIKKNLINSLLMPRAIFVIFMVFVAIVLMNVMVGVAVPDVQDLLLGGHLLRLEKQVEFLHSLEVPTWKKSFYGILALNKWLKCKKVKQIVTIKSAKIDDCCYNGYIREIIMNKAQEQLDKMEQIEKIIKSESKLEEILKAVTIKEQNIVKIESKLDHALQVITTQHQALRIKSKWDKIIQCVMKKAHSNEKELTSRVEEIIGVEQKMALEFKLHEIGKTVSLNEQKIANIESKLDVILAALMKKEPVYAH